MIQETTTSQNVVALTADEQHLYELIKAHCPLAIAALENQATQFHSLNLPELAEEYTFQLELNQQIKEVLAGDLVHQMLEKKLDVTMKMLCCCNVVMVKRGCDLILDIKEQIRRLSDPTMMC